VPLRRQRHLAIEVAEAALRAHHDTDLHVGQGGEVMREQAQGHGLACAGIAGDESEAAIAHLMLHAPAEVIGAGGDHRARRHVGGKGIPI